jgi:hypothetical protein
VWDGGLEGVEAIVQRQQGVLAIGGGVPLLRFGDRLRVDAMALARALKLA